MSIYSFNGDAISGSVSVDSPYAPVTLVTDRFNQTLAQAQEVLELLIGTEGSGGLVGAMESALSPAPTPVVTAQNVDTTVVLDETGLTLPTFTGTLVAVPTVDVDFTGIALPADITLAMNWVEATLPADVFNALKTQLLADLIDGSTGITAEVETAIYTRARNRQQADRLAAYNRINDSAGQMQYALPSGVLVSALADFEIAANRQDADIENGIIETQAKLAQENRKSAMQQAIALDQLLRQTRSDESGRALEGAKTLAQVTIQEYSEKIKAFQAIWDGKKAEVQAKAENVRAAVETNTGLIDVYKAEVQAFGEAEKAVATKNDSKIKILEQKIANADLDLRGQIAEANAIVESYVADMGVKQRISSDRAQIAMQTAASLLSAVNASANLGYSGSESASKGYHIQVSGSEQHSYQEI